MVALASSNDALIGQDVVIKVYKDKDEGIKNEIKVL